MQLFLEAVPIILKIFSKVRGNLLFSNSSSWYITMIFVIAILYYIDCKVKRSTFIDDIAYVYPQSELGGSYRPNKIVLLSLHVVHLSM